MTSHGISLIIPVYNGSGYLRESIDSALNQTLKPRQIIVVNDGSTDDSEAIARAYGDAVTVIRQANCGISAARNRGLAEATEPLIAFLDADDRFSPHKLDRQYQALMEHPAASLCICRVQDFWSPELPESARKTAVAVPQFRVGQPGSWLARRELFERVGTFSDDADCRFIEGSELFIRIETSGCEVVRIDDLLVERRLHLSNHTSNSKAHLDGIMTLMRRRRQLRRVST